jgi:hypothetical protein
MKLPKERDFVVYNEIVRRNMTIRGVALASAVSPSTIRRAVDRVADFNRQRFDIELSGAELQDVLTCLRGNVWSRTSANLADRLEEIIGGQ